MYNDEVIQISGGLNDYIGKLDQSPHPMGEGWYRIKDPCITFSKQDPNTKQVLNVVASLHGPQNNFRKFVDIRIPDGLQMEIKVIDKTGELYKFYQKEINRETPQNIILPNFGIATGPN